MNIFRNIKVIHKKFLRNRDCGKQIGRGLERKGYSVHTAVCNGVVMHATTCDLIFYIPEKHMKKV